MSPTFTENYHGNGWLSDTVLCGEFVLASPAFCVCSSYRDNLIVIQSSERMLRAIPGTVIALSSFGNHIANVILASTKEEVLRSHATADVTVMKDPKPARNLTKVHFTRKPVSSDGMGHLPVATPGGPCLHRAGAQLWENGRPILIYFSPESFCGRLTLHDEPPVFECHSPGGYHLAGDFPTNYSVVAEAK